jgi:hypothetical protein
MSIPKYSPTVSQPVQNSANIPPTPGYSPSNSSLFQSDVKNAQV